MLQPVSTYAETHYAKQLSKLKKIVKVAYFFKNSTFPH